MKAFVYALFIFSSFVHPQKDKANERDVDLSYLVPDALLVRYQSLLRNKAIPIVDGRRPEGVQQFDAYRTQQYRNSQFVESVRPMNDVIRENFSGLPREIDESLLPFPKAPVVLGTTIPREGQRQLDLTRIQEMGNMIYFHERREVLRRRDSDRAALIKKHKGLIKSAANNEEKKKKTTEARAALNKFDRERGSSKDFDAAQTSIYEYFKDSGLRMEEYRDSLWNKNGAFSNIEDTSVKGMSDQIYAELALLSQDYDREQERLLAKAKHEAGTRSSNTPVQPFSLAFDDALKFAAQVQSHALRQPFRSHELAAGVQQLNSSNVKRKQSMIQPIHLRLASQAFERRFTKTSGSNAGGRGLSHDVRRAFGGNHPQLVNSLGVVLSEEAAFILKAYLKDKKKKSFADLTATQQEELKGVVADHYDRILDTVDMLVKLGHFPSVQNNAGPNQNKILAFDIHYESRGGEAKRVRENILNVARNLSRVPLTTRFDEGKEYGAALSDYAKYARSVKERIKGNQGAGLVKSPEQKDARSPTDLFKVFLKNNGFLFSNVGSGTQKFINEDGVEYEAYHI